MQSEFDIISRLKEITAELDQLYREQGELNKAKVGADPGIQRSISSRLTEISFEGQELFDERRELKSLLIGESQQI